MKIGSQISIRSEAKIGMITRFATKRKSKNLKRKQSGNKRNEAKKSKQNEMDQKVA